MVSINGAKFYHAYSYQHTPCSPHGHTLHTPCSQRGTHCITPTCPHSGALLIAFFINLAVVSTNAANFYNEECAALDGGPFACLSQARTCFYNIITIMKV